jgi:hypothetical protein
MTAMYGCWNREPFKLANVLDRPFPPGPLAIPHTMTRDCQYTKSALGQEDPKCLGCKHKEVK